MGIWRSTSLIITIFIYLKDVQKNKGNEDALIIQ